MAKLLVFLAAVLLAFCEIQAFMGGLGGLAGLGAMGRMGGLGALYGLNLPAYSGVPGVPTNYAGFDFPINIDMPIHLGQNIMSPNAQINTANSQNSISGGYY